MIGNILHTFGSKIIIALISFLILLLNANYLGVEGLGTVGLFVLIITIVILISNLICGSIIYFSSRLNISNLTINAYLWSLISVLLFWIVNQLYPLIEASLEKHLYLLAFMQSGMSIHQYLLLGSEKIKLHNILSTLQSVITLLALVTFYYFIENQSIFAFINSLYLSYGLTWFLGVVFTVRQLPKVGVRSLRSDFKASFHYGFFAQAANTFQLLNYRISYFFLDAISGRAALGMYTAGVQLSEALLMPGRSIATVQYARISRRKKEVYARRITILFMKLSFLITLVGTAVLVAIPAEFFGFILGEDFTQVKPILWAMSFGIIALSAVIVLSHYFSGTGQQKMNSLSALIGLILTLLGCLILIPQYGALGAALSTAISYCGMFLFLFYLMVKDKKNKAIDFIPNVADWKLLRRILKR
jgi:O-antigen/teichoic acid export membrane protein